MVTLKAINNSSLFKSPHQHSLLFSLPEFLSLLTPGLKYVKNLIKLPFCFILVCSVILGCGEEFRIHHSRVTDSKRSLYAVVSPVHVPLMLRISRAFFVLRQKLAY